MRELPAIVQAAMDSSPGSPAGNIVCSITTACRRRTRRHPDGLRRRDRARNGRPSAAGGEKVGVLQVRLYRPFSAPAFLRRPAGDLPRGRRARQDQGAGRERRAALSRRRRSLAQAVSPAGAGDAAVSGGRYGLSSKDFSPAMAKAVFESSRSRAQERIHRRNRRRW